MSKDTVIILVLFWPKMKQNCYDSKHILAEEGPVYAMKLEKFS